MFEPFNTPDSPDSSRRFGGIAQLYGAAGAQELAGAHVMVAGLGGVGSWCVEALARSGVGALTLVDMDHVSESNINRQVQAVSQTVGQAKVSAMAGRIRQIHPDCRLTLVDDFVTAENVGALLAAAAPVSALVDCVDDVRAKVAMILAARAAGLPLLVCGGAGGKTQPLALRQGDLAQAVNDALLARVRQILRREQGYPKGQTKGQKKGRAPRMRVSALWVDEPVRLPEAWRTVDADKGSGLACAGYGSVVTVTASMGFAAATQVMQWVVGASGTPDRMHISAKDFAALQAWLDRPSVPNARLRKTMQSPTSWETS